ncbi:MAG: beta-ACP synthase [Rhodobacteraceae bacterium]|nr:MAG: beta-ACP synthase [Paracoccaceae bacterium]|tara:strand:- start:128 stop:1336 length:1209 start_codon:yes stop_codon:yes gene_type:complete
MKRVVITGSGAISALGYNTMEHYNSLMNGICGIKTLEFKDSDSLSIKIGAMVGEYRADKFFSLRDLSFFDRYTQFAIIAAREAMSQSGFEINMKNSDKVGVIIGNSGGGLQTLDENYREVFKHQKKQLHPFIVPKLMANAASSQLSIIFDVKGPSFTVSAACASSNHAMGQAFKLIQTGQLIAAITGGSESMLCFGGLKAWEGLRVMTNTKCRPFSRNRDGMSQGEGAAIFVFEEYDSASRRGAEIIAEVVGFSMTSDATHIVRPDKDGAKRAMMSALNDAKLNTSQIGYINAHGTGTILNDKIEAIAINQVFRDSPEAPLVSSTKSSHGHLIGGAGAIELVSCLMSLRCSVIPPTINYEEKDPDCNLNLVVNNSIEKKIEYSLSNAFAFGGSNSVLILKKF